MKRLDGFVTREIGGKLVAVAVGERTKTFNGMITLNSTAALLWEALETEQTEDSLVDTLMGQFEVSKEKAGADVSDFLKKLEKAGLLL
jgi:transposase-like protein